MLSRRWTKYVAGIVMLVFILPGAFLVSGGLGREQDAQSDAAAGRAATCSRLVDQLVSGLDAFTRQFDGLSGLDTGRIPAMPSMQQLRSEAAGFVDRSDEADCDETDARKAAEQWREDDQATGPLAVAVGAALAANVLDVLDNGTEQVRHELSTGEDLASVLADLPTGATLVLPPGRFVLQRTVAIVQDLTIEGAGPKRTRIVSRAPGAAVVLASQVAMRMAGVRVAHAGGGTASVLVLRAGAAELEDVQVTGATRTKSGDGVEGGPLAGGSGVVMAGGQRLEMRESSSSHNATGGLLVATGAPRVEGSSFTDNDVCGVCFVGSAGGRLHKGVLTRNGAGVMLGDRSAPRLDANRIEHNSNAGLVLEASAHPRVSRNTITGNGGIGVAVYAKASPRLSGNTITGHGQAGILVDVGPRTTVRVTGNQLRDNGSAGLVFMGRSGGKASGNACSGSRFGLVLDGSASPELGRNDCSLQDQRSRG